MKRNIIISSVCLFLLLSINSVSAIPTVFDVVSNISQNSYTNYLDNMLYTHIGDNRGIGGAEHDLARNNIYAAFNSFGLTTSYNPFTYSGNTYNNVVGVLTGKTRPNDIYIIGAHYDSVDNPGADDNASGTAGVLEAARVMSNYKFEATLVFIAFDREEQGLVGSKAYATGHASDNILGMVSLDMIAYNDGSDMARIYGSTASSSLKSELAEAMATYSLITAIDSGKLDASDHAPFEWQGFQAALLIEYGVWSNPYYHTAADSVDTPNYIDYAYATNMVCGAVGFFADSAILIPEPAALTIFIFGAALIRLASKRREK